MCSINLLSYVMKQTVHCPVPSTLLLYIPFALLCFALLFAFALFCETGSGYVAQTGLVFFFILAFQMLELQEFTHTQLVVIPFSSINCLDTITHGHKVLGAMTKKEKDL